MMCRYHVVSYLHLNILEFFVENGIKVSKFTNVATSESE